MRGAYHRRRSLTGFALIVSVLSLGETAAAECLPAGTPLTIPNPDPGPDDHFGEAVAIDGRFAVAGAPLDDPGGIRDGGSIHIFDATGGSLLHSIPNPDMQAQGRFGVSVAVSGNLVAAGADLNRGPGGINENSPVGAVYIFDAPSGRLLRRVDNPEPATQWYFGWSVAVSGNLASAGGIQPGDFLPRGPGKAFVFDALTGEPGALLHHDDPAIPGVGGYSVAVSGGRVLAGAMGAIPSGLPYEGAAFLFEAETGERIHTLRNPEPAMDDEFGRAVALDGDVAVAGTRRDDPGGVDWAGSVYVFSAGSGELRWTLTSPEPANRAAFGSAISVRGTRILAGEPGAAIGGTRDAGKVHLFDAETGTLIASHPNPAGEIASRFGESAGISDGQWIAGAPGSSGEPSGTGVVYIFGCPPRPARVLSHLLGLTGDPSGLDANGDGGIDVADLAAGDAPQLPGMDHGRGRPFR